MADEKTPKIMKFWIVLSILVSMCLMSTMVILHLMHIRLSDEVSNLKTEVQILKLKSRVPLSTMQWVKLSIIFLMVKESIEKKTFYIKKATKLHLDPDRELQKEVHFTKQPKK